MKSLLLVCLIFMFTPSYSLRAQSLTELRAVKITNVDSDVLFSNAKTAEAMDYLASIGVNTILTVVWNGNGASGDHTLYPSAVMDNYFGKPIHPAFTNRDPLQRVVIEAHRNGMEVLPWFEMGFSTSYSQNGGHILETYPDWALKDVNDNLVVKNGFDWMSAINPDVQDFIRSLTVEVAVNYDVDGIEYSDRIPAMPVEGGYDYETLALYIEEHDGQDPPDNYNDPGWKRWRADKLTDFFQSVRDTIKSIDPNLVVSSSPSLYPWSYDNYLQDSKTWVERGIVDNIIPQVYRYNYSDYLFELNKSLNNFPGYRDIYFSGMLIKSGSYVIEPDFFLKALRANRDRNVNGEAFFFYEALRAHNNLLGDTLKAAFYAQPALTPDRDGKIRRPKATVVNEDDADVVISGNWQTAGEPGFKDSYLKWNSTGSGSVEYFIDVPFAAWFDVFTYIVPDIAHMDAAPYIVYSQNDSFDVVLDQSNEYKNGWQLLKSVYLEKGKQKVLRLTAGSNGGSVMADATMIMINRKLSPDVIVTDLPEKSASKEALPKTLTLYRNFPNPFNPATTIRYALDRSGPVSLKVFNILGREITVLVNNEQSPGIHQVRWNGQDKNGVSVGSGLYFYVLQAGEKRLARKMMLVK